ncbi:MAG TPA: DUF2332 family protein, partial [Thermoleophilaceae bacterium]|nr:DUF2332 family protein [Thermoleophilaceae bacterium]
EAHRRVSERVARRLRRQAAACEQLGSRLYGELLSRSAEDVEAGGPIAALLDGHGNDERGSALALRALIEDAGARATADAPLAWLAMEPPANPDEQPLAEVRLRLWPGGDERLIALTGYHGRPIHWLA